MGGGFALLAATRDFDVSVPNYGALSVVGTQRLAESGYFRAKIAQEEMVRRSPIPYSIVHATQFFEFIKSIADSATEGGAVRLPPILVQPIAADDVADAVCQVALAPPVNGTIEVAGPQQFRLDELVEDTLRAHHDTRVVSADSKARYFGVELGERSLLPDSEARIANTYLKEWQSHVIGAG